MRSQDGHIYLIDFGIARHFKPGQAKDTSNYGSMGYAPPEQYGKAQTTERSDIYSLGATLYECISGYDPSQSPFLLPPLQTLISTLPERLVKLITQMLEMGDKSISSQPLLPILCPFLLDRHCLGKRWR
jgi:serine/threonine protein kinase